VFTDDGVIAYEAMGVLALPTEILRVGADYGTVIDFGVAANARTFHYRGIGHYFAMVANLDILVDESERMNDDIVAELGGRINVGKRTYHSFRFRGFLFANIRIYFEF